MRMPLKKYLPKGLFARTFLIVVVPVLISQLAISIVFFDRHWSKMTQRLAGAVAGDIAAVIHLIEMNEDIANVQDIARRDLGMIVTFAPNVSDLPQRSIKGSQNIATDLQKSMQQRLEMPFQITVFGDDKLVIVDVKIDQGVIRFDVPEGRLFSSSSYIFILWMIGLSIILFAIALLFMRNQIRPIYRLGLIAERMGRGIPVDRFKPTGAREVRQAAEAFIQMQNRIHGFINQRTTMLAGVSHDLRTPLTRMKLQLAMLGDTPDVEAMKKDISDMEHMIEGYLSFAKGDEGEEVQSVSVLGFVEQLSEDARRLNLNVTDSYKDIEDRLFWIKPKALMRAFGNFLSNAARYADTVHIYAIINEENLTISISDNGSGIPENIRADVLKPFFRGEQSRNQKTGGVGLGLTIANDIILSHGGSIDLSGCDDLYGLKVTVTLPF